MYSHEDKMGANELYLRYHRSTAAVINELGYPNCQTLRLWYMELEENGGLSRGCHQRYDDLRKKAVDDRFFDRGAMLRPRRPPSRISEIQGIARRDESAAVQVVAQSSGMSAFVWKTSASPPNAGVMVDGYRCLSCDEVSRILDALLRFLDSCNSIFSYC